MDDITTTLRISAAGMRTQGTRLRVIAENIANAESLPAQPGDLPYRRRVRREDGASPYQALVGNVRTCRSDAKGDVQTAETVRIRVPMRSTGAERFVVGRKVL
jgi:flagellar basal body rod protein FlgC